MKRLIQLSVLMCIGASAMAAEGFRAEATLAQPVSEPKQVTISKAQWKCENDRCVGTAERRSLDSFIKECRRVAGELGELKSYTSRGREMSKNQLASCNRAASK